MNFSRRTHLRVQRPFRRLSLLGSIQSRLVSFFALLAVTVQFSRVRRPTSLHFFNWKRIGVLLGVLLFYGITTHANPASAQLFNNVESQVTTIFGSNLDQTIIAFMFGVLRIVIWVTSVGFILFAVYQAQRGEQWQPLMQNAFIVVAAVVIVEGMSQLFFGVSGGT